MYGIRYFLLLILILSAVSISGQTLSVDYDKKVIYTDSLNLPDNASALTLVTLLPELIQRPGAFLVTNYDIQIEGMSVGNAVDVTLSQLQIVDIEKMEVSESPVTSYQKNGQGGSINFVLRSKGSENPDRWGSAGLSMSNPLDIAPQFTIGYRKGKFMIRAIMLSELSNLSADMQSLTFVDGEYSSQSNTTAVNRFRMELARAYMQFNLTDKDVLKLNISEMYTYDRTNSITDYNPAKAVLQRNKSAEIHAYLKYQHKTDRSTFTAQAEYAYTPTNKDDDVSGSYQIDGDVKTNNLSGKLEYKTCVFNSAKVDGMLQRGDITLGCNYNAVFGDMNTTIVDKIVSSPVTKIIPQNNTYYLMPYLTFESTLGKLRIKATGEFQHFQYDVKRLDKPFTSRSNDFTGQFITEYRFTPDNTLRLMLDRKLQRPTSDQLFPYQLFDADRREYVQGNPDLTPIMVHQVALDYIGLYRWDNTQKLTYNLGASYNRITDIVNGVYPSSGQIVPGSLGAKLKYVTFENNGNDKIVSANAMAMYTHNAFSLSFAGNLYHMVGDVAKVDTHCTYYNLSVYPYFKLKEGWHGGACFMYYSRINQQNGYVGDCAVMDITVGRSWGRFYVYIGESMSFAKNNTDVTDNGKTHTEQNYLLSPNTVSAGFKYTF